jgi:acid phosphatase type 7
MTKKLFSTVLLCVLISFSLAESAEPKSPWLDKKHVEKRMDGLAKVAGKGPSQWRVIWTQDPATSATVSWTTATKGKTHQVSYAKQYPNKDVKKESTVVLSHRDGPYSGADGEHYHHARLTGLKASTAYRFVITSDGESSPPMHFTTAPADDRDFHLLFGGDSRSGHFTRAQVNLLMAALAEEDEDLIAFAHGGDYISSGKNWGQWSRWLSQHELTVAASGKVLPIIPTRGNHDGGPLYDEIFDSPGSSGKNYFSTKLSSKVALVTLNSEISVGGSQRTWLGKTLSSLRPEVRWLLAEYHRPAWPAVKKPGSPKQFWVPLFEQFNVDLAVESDGHVIKRTVPIRNEKKDSTGVVYVGEGGLGVSQRRPDRNRWYLKAPGMTGVGHHVMRVSFGKKQLDYEVILLDRKVADRTQLRPR